MTQIGRMTDSV